MAISGAVYAQVFRQFDYRMSLHAIFGALALLIISFLVLRPAHNQDNDT